MKYSKKEYNDEPIHYCHKCLSINIKALNNSDYYVCRECGTPYIENDEVETNIDEWNMLYIEEYGKPFLSEEESIVE